jgi:anaerobic dimethyl sulfoxide reductase subunit B (iron-sulfur subunit)
MLKNPALYFNGELCTGCKTCMIACKDKNNLPVGVLWRRVLEYSGGDWIPSGDNAFHHSVFAYYVSISCNHCENAPCVKGCPTTAMKRDESNIVFIDQERCVGCRYCEWNCPYGAPQFNEEAKAMTKCDFCRDELAQGYPPTCVAACPNRALDFGEYDELVKKHGDLSAVAPLPDPSVTSPRFICSPHRFAKALGSSAGMRGALISNPEEV